VKAKFFVGKEVGNGERGVMDDACLGYERVIVCDGEIEDGFVGEDTSDGNDGGEMVFIAGEDYVGGAKGFEWAPTDLTPQPPLHRWRGGAGMIICGRVRGLTPWPPLHGMERGNLIGPNTATTPDGVERRFGTVPRVARGLPTLGWRTQSLWD